MESFTLHKGLSSEEVIRSGELHGKNVLISDGDRVFLHVLKEVVLEPMFILLLVSGFIYFIAGQYREGIIMVIAVFIVAGISLFQEYRSRNAIQALKKLSASRAMVIRNGIRTAIPAEDVVVGDIMLLEEGELIAADGRIISANDLSLNESILTGESFPVYKSAGNGNHVYKGTLVSSGSAVTEVTEIGSNTLFGKIGLSMKEVTILKTPLQNQVKSFVKNMAWIGALAFLLVIGYHYFYTRDLLSSFLQGLTLAMSVLPEEIPVAFSTFQALGAFRLLRNNIIVKQPQYVETLGSATVVCADKTGTLTRNSMRIRYLYDAGSDQVFSPDETDDIPAELLEYAMWSSETDPFDPMERAIHELYGVSAEKDKRKTFIQVHEYPVSGRPPMMTHIFSNDHGETIIAAKGAPEAILNQCNLDRAALQKLEEQSLYFARQGYRVLGVGKGKWTESKWPVSQSEFVFEFLGLIAFHDPPKQNTAQTIKRFYEAGIQLKIITGDYAETTMAIASQVGLKNNGEVLLGEEVLRLNPEELKEKVKAVNIFARMFPEAKMNVINALIENGEVVAMTGDGVNDGPALKAAHIGIAMGQRGSEVAKSAASLILVDDDLSHMVDAVALGRKIYDNLKKAIQYIVSIHIPIILVVILPLLLMWPFTDIFSPVHVIFLELIMGPTCSVIYENEPMEPGTMSRPPRKLINTFLSFQQLLLSVIQGLVITAGCLGIGYYYLYQFHDETLTRTVIFTTLLLCNIFLTLVNRSFHFTVFSTIRYANPLVYVIIIITLIFMLTLQTVPFMQHLFRIGNLSLAPYANCILVAFCSCFWVEGWKLTRQK